MAALGSIGRTYETRNPIRPADVWINNGYSVTSVLSNELPDPVAFASTWYRSLWGTAGVFTTSREDGSISGTVTENSVPVFEADVFLFWRGFPVAIGYQKSKADGTFTFTKLDPDSNNYMVIAFDPAGGVQYNAIAFDRLTPV